MCSFLSVWWAINKTINKHHNATKSSSVNSLLNFEIVKYFGSEKFEEVRYKEDWCYYVCVCMYISQNRGVNL